MATAAVEIQPWPNNRTDIPSRGRALVLPGGGYTVDHPVLFWTCQVLAASGWRVTAVRWRVDDSVATDPLPFVELAADSLEEATASAGRTLVVGKSLGSYAARWASKRRYPGVWLTPVLTADAVASALTAYGPPALLVGGTADSLWVSQVAHATGKEVLELSGADHALHVGHDWRASLGALHTVLAAIESFASDLQ